MDELKELFVNLSKKNLCLAQILGYILWVFGYSPQFFFFFLNFLTKIKFSFICNLWKVVIQPHKLMEDT